MNLWRPGCMLALLAATAAHAQVYPLNPNEDLIGEDGQTTSVRADTLPDIARRYHLGYDEINAANPGVDADRSLLEELGLGISNGQQDDGKRRQQNG